ncbi:hypothetical protein [Lactobacillus helveticus]|uniref:hypothetical protein n=1 Tax=Lactobacillus helveticus TaxID=1587 RepID=UPI000AC7AF61|nr:hypothetical protein [Lactobacillus helveticus]
MENKIWVSAILLIIILATGATPTYKNYRYWLQRKLGYWNALVPIAILVVMNLVAWIWSWQGHAIISFACRFGVYF